MNAPQTDNAKARALLESFARGTCLADKAAAVTSLLNRLDEHPREILNRCFIREPLMNDADRWRSIGAWSFAAQLAASLKKEDRGTFLSRAISRFASPGEKRILEIVKTEMNQEISKAVAEFGRLAESAGLIESARDSGSSNRQDMRL